MSYKLFLENQFKKRKIPAGTGYYKHYEECKKVIQLQSKLSPQVYNELLKIAADYVGVKEVER